MKLNHINLVVTDVSAAVALFEAYFDFSCQQIKGDNAIAIMQGRDGFSLVLMSATVSKVGDATYPDAFHIGFMQESRDAVTVTWQRLKDAGIIVGREPGKIRDTFGFYFVFQNIMIEVGCTRID